MINYTDSAAGITPDRLKGFFVGWPNPPSPEIHLKLLKSSDHIILARDSQSEQVVGFVNAISDNVLAAYIPLLEVLPEYQKRGIGSQLMQRMLAKLDGLYMIDLMCNVELQPYYERFGMKKMSAMMIRDFEHQSGE